jgi:oligogalacturonide lyase
LYLCNVDVVTNETIKYKLPFKRASWHYNISPDGKRICGDGSRTSQEEHWIYILTPDNGTMKIDRICDMRKHNYLRAPNTHFTPDGKWVIFNADFGNGSQVYAVEVEKSK